MQELFVDTPEALAALAEQLAGSEWLALDTEFIREKTYRPRLCLIQVSNGEVAAGVDPLALDDLQPLLDVLYDGRILKVFHAARQDLEIFLQDWGGIPLPLFDTQPAAALLGHGDQIGYAKLVQQVLNVDLPKDHSRTDWSRRPLDSGQLRYALDDVIYLGRIYLDMRGRLSERDRLQWLAADFATLADPATYVQDPNTAWQRIKGRQHLRPAQLAVLRALAAWREQQAVERDLPRKWVLKDEVLVDLAKRGPQELNQLERIRGLEPAQIRRHGSTLLELIATARQTPKEQWPVDSRGGKPLSHGQEAQVDLLGAALRVIADRHQLSPNAIGNRKDLEKLVRREGNTSLLNGWRKVVAGDLLCEVLDGRYSLRCRDNELLLQPAEAQTGG